MTGQSFSVAIAGGGIGGLCLAQGLNKAGIKVAVYERDRARTERLQGYRLHISPAGSRALYECLPPRLFETFVATSAVSGGRFRFLTDQMHELLSFEERKGASPVERHYSASRITLRQVLLAELEGNVHFDKAFVSFAEEPDGRIRMHFADGSSESCDLLVGADGGNSRVRKQFLPHAQRIDTGVVGIAGKLMLTGENRQKAPPSLLRGSGLVMGSGRCSMFLGLQEFAGRSSPAAGEIGGQDEAYAIEPGALFDNTTSYLMWAYGGYRAEIEKNRKLEDLTGAELQVLVLRHIARWHPDFREMVRLSDPSSLNALTIRTSAPVAAWEPRRVTLIGDAIHSMTPYRGIGANVALRDAAILRANLITARNAECSIEAAVGAYEEQMRNYGFAAVRGSFEAMKQALAGKSIMSPFVKLALRAIDRYPLLKRRFLAKFEDQWAAGEARTSN
jgi:2-polyprenyl-6-methoxyphenol hydroxylase-like FAD-dependent oxidoreductase